MSKEDMAHRPHLPIPDAPSSGLDTYDAKDPDTKFPRIEPLRPPRGAPHVLIVLIDDVGFGASSAFGGPCQTPTAERLAANGLCYNRFHTTALCSPTRQALLTGRNHHTVSMGGITEMATSAPGNCSIRTKSCAPTSETQSALHRACFSTDAGSCWPFFERIISRPILFQVAVSNSCALSVKIAHGGARQAVTRESP